MHKVEELAYVGIAASDLEAWRSYATEVIGLEITTDSDDENLYLRMDDHHHRFIVHPADNIVDDVAYVGWQVRDRRAMDAVACQLEAAGVTVRAGSTEEARERRVMGFVHFTDPHTNLRMEVAYGCAHMFMPRYLPTRPISGFSTGDLGLGHFVTFVPDVPSAEDFYADVLGFATSDAPGIPGGDRFAAFMYCNPRHHSLAFFKHPAPLKRAQHVMLEYTSLDDVGTAYDICRARGEVKVELGRHMNDHMVSFYSANPSGWLFELGWGARTIDPVTFAVEHYPPGPHGIGEWGHAGLAEMLR